MKYDYKQPRSNSSDLFEALHERFSEVPLLSGGFVLCWRHEENYQLLGLLSAFGATVFRAAKSVVQGALLMVVFSALIVNLLIDMVYHLIDPRVRVDQ